MEQQTFLLLFAVSAYVPPVKTEPCHKSPVPLCQQDAETKHTKVIPLATLTRQQSHTTEMPGAISIKSLQCCYKDAGGKRKALNS